MNFWNLLRGAFPYTEDAKPSPVNDAGSNMPAEESMTPESAKTVSEKQPSSEAHLTGKSGKAMTVEQAKKKWVEWSKSQVGYKENPDGSNKYAAGDWDVRLYGFEGDNVPWCDIFSDYSYIACFGFEAATKMTYQQPKGFAACALSAEAYKQNGAFFPTPEVGDQVFFIYGDGINHVGNVVSVNGDTVECVEGNFSNGVHLTKYNIRNQWIIAGYGRPDWSVVATEEETVISEEVFEDSEEIDIVHPAYKRTFIHLERGDGVQSNGYIPVPQVKAWQNLLLCWGLDLGACGADGEFGLDTENATRQWQKQAQAMGADVEVNGVVDQDDWVEIINVPG